MNHPVQTGFWYPKLLNNCLRVVIISAFSFLVSPAFQHSPPSTPTESLRAHETGVREAVDVWGYLSCSVGSISRNMDDSPIQVNQLCRIPRVTGYQYRIRPPLMLDTRHSEPYGNMEADKQSQCVLHAMQQRSQWLSICPRLWRAERIMRYCRWFGALCASVLVQVSPVQSAKPLHLPVNQFRGFQSGGICCTSTIGVTVENGAVDMWLACFEKFALTLHAWTFSRSRDEPGVMRPRAFEYFWLWRLLIFTCPWKNGPVI